MGNPDRGQKGEEDMRQHKTATWHVAIQLKLTGTGAVGMFVRCAETEGVVAGAGAGGAAAAAVGGAAAAGGAAVGV